MSELLQKLPNVYSLVFDTDISLYPTSYMVLMSQYPITCLSIWVLSLFPSWATLFNFIWVFPELSKLRLGSHLDGLPGKKDIVDELTLSKGARLSAIAARGRCSRLRTLELYALAPTQETWRHRRMANELQILVQSMYANNCALRKLRFRFAAPETTNDLSLPFNAKLLLDTYFQHLFVGPIQLTPAWRFLRQIEIELPSNDLPAPCLAADWWKHYLRANAQLPFDGDIEISVSFHRAYYESLRIGGRRAEADIPPFAHEAYLDPDETLPPAWYCIRHRAAVVSTICTEECFKKGPLPYDIAEGFEELRI
ncbi:hypothetical protein TRAPUB_13783 [Trametes pubescens]|uniref:Uncharacterized protein n=1 Tax=Trametes pubescens TaxID=154538 RepID=A0A1M2VQH9_TRAPU|nr:hypothetical protein TRAPUB_13783 [Trametes pubescens]